MDVHKGRKAAIPVMLTDRLLAKVDEIAAARDGEPNRSAVIRDLLGEAIEAREKAVMR
jgi:metal-responsive CopG/Arc/MetJ family transcriptional regulator